MLKIDLIKRHEGLRLKAYLCPAGKPTIGYGNTFYPDGRPVRLGETISRETAEKMLSYTAGIFADAVLKAVGRSLNSNQLSSLTSLAYNIGVANFKGSSVLRLVKANPDDTSIRAAFAMWNKVRDPKTKVLKVSAGLVKRRAEEADLYFTRH